MQHNTTVARPISWRLAVPQLIVLAGLVAASALLLSQRYGWLSVSIGAFVYLFYSYGSRFLLLRHHRQGRLLTDRGEFNNAIEAFDKSYAFFSRYRWLDQYRYLTMMIPARQSYREMALINIAYCYVQLGSFTQAEVYYRRALQEFPDSVMARSGLDAVQALDTTS